MTGYTIVNLADLLEEKGEVFTKNYLSSFSCPHNKDVEEFLHKKAISFSQQGFSKTHLVMASNNKNHVLAGYFALANKYISVKSTALSNSLKKKLNKFATYDINDKSYHLSAPLIAQLGKNYTDGYNKLITGNELLELACMKIKNIQYDIGGKFVYVECEDKPQLTSFYSRNGFYEFDKRYLDADETNLHGEYLLQMLKYLKK